MGFYNFKKGVLYSISWNDDISVNIFCLFLEFIHLFDEQ